MTTGMQSNNQLEHEFSTVAKRIVSAVVVAQLVTPSDSPYFFICPALKRPLVRWSIRAVQTASSQHSGEAGFSVHSGSVRSRTQD